MWAEPSLVLRPLFFALRLKNRTSQAVRPEGRSTKNDGQRTKDYSTIPSSSHSLTALGTRVRNARVAWTIAFLVTPPFTRMQ